MVKLSELLSTQDVARMFGFSTGHRYIVHLIQTGQLKAIRVKGRYLITPDAVEDYRRARSSKINKRIQRTAERNARIQRRKERNERRKLKDAQNNTTPEPGEPAQGDYNRETNNNGGEI